MPTDIALLVVIIALLGVIGAETYFLYLLATTVAVLNAAPDAESARTLLRTVKTPPPTPPKKKEPVAVNPGDISEQGVKNLRALQDDNGR